MLQIVTFFKILSLNMLLFYELLCIVASRLKMPSSIRYGTNVKIAKCLSQLGIEKS